MINHPNLLQLREVYESEDKVYLVNEYMSGGEAVDNYYRS